jgi:arylsulfatase A-like enzyme
MPEYRDSTTLIVTSDHGRGSTLADWSGHGRKVEGADKIWMAIMGPDTPAAGEVSTHAEQRDIAPTIIKLLGQNPADYEGATGKPIPAAFKP